MEAFVPYYFAATINCNIALIDEPKTGSFELIKPHSVDFLL